MFRLLGKELIYIITVQIRELYKSLSTHYRSACFDEIAFFLNMQMIHKFRGRSIMMTGTYLFQVEGFVSWYESLLNQIILCSVKITLLISFNTNFRMHIPSPANLNLDVSESSIVQDWVESGHGGFTRLLQHSESSQILAGRTTNCWARVEDERFCDPLVPRGA